MKHKKLEKYLRDKYGDYYYKEGGSRMVLTKGGAKVASSDTTYIDRLERKMLAKILIYLRWKEEEEEEK